VQRSAGLENGLTSRYSEGEIDYILFAVTVSFYCLGAIMVFSASVNKGLEIGDYTYFFKRQLIWIVISIFFCFGFIFLDHHMLERLVKPMVIVTILFLILMLVPYMVKSGLVHPARRWFRVGGIGFQPSEFAKITIILYLSSIFSRKGNKIKDFYRGFLPPFIIISFISFLVFLEPDFSTAFLLFFLSILMFFVAGIRTASIISLFIVSIPALFLMVSEKSYRRERIIGFINPWMDPTDKGYQIIQSFKAFAMGGLTGVGLGRGMQKMRYLPIPHTDYIFAVMAEELGFAGVLMVIGLYMIFAYRGFMIAKAQENSFNFFLAFGITSLIVWEAIFNIAVVTGLLPSTGISLPFLSYGGSNLLANSVLVGILLNLSRKKVNAEFPLQEDYQREGFGDLKEYSASVNIGFVEKNTQEKIPEYLSRN